MRILKKIILVIIGVVLSGYILLWLVEKGITTGEIEHEKNNIESNINYYFQTYPKAYQILYEQTIKFPNIHQLQFYEDGRISFYIKHCLPGKSRDTHCFFLEIKDTNQIDFEVVNFETLVTKSNGKMINTENWIIHFTGQSSHPNLPKLFDQLNIDIKQLNDLKMALEEARIDVSEHTYGFTKNKSMAIFGAYSLLTSIDYIIPLSEEVDVSDFTKLNNHYYYGTAKRLRYFEPE